jgi:hypothetical protein
MQPRRNRLNHLSLAFKNTMENTNKILPENTLPSSNVLSWKVWVLAIASLLFQTLTWYGIRQAVSNPSLTHWITLIVVAAIAISLTAFFILISKTRWLVDSLIVLSAASYFFISPRNVYVWIGGLIFALFAIWYEERLRHEIKSRIDFSVTRVIGSSISILIYAIMLMLGFNIYYNVSADFKANPDKYYDRLGQQAARTVPYFSKAFPVNVDLNQSLNDYVSQETQKDPGYSSANRIQREILLNETKKELEARFQIQASNNDTLAQIIGEAAVTKIRQMSEPYQDYLPIVFSIVVVGILYSFAFLIRWIILIISWILFRILLWIGFFKLAKVQVEVEKLEI